MTENMERFIRHVRRVADRDMVVGDDGFRTWCPSRAGGFRPLDLRVIADYMDELDEPWHQQVEKDFGPGGRYWAGGVEDGEGREEGPTEAARDIP